MKMSIWFLLSRLAHGGLERVQLNLAETLYLRGYDIRLVAGKLTTALLPERHEYGTLEIAGRGAWYFPIGLWRALRNDEPAIVFTTANDIACLVLLLRRITFRSLRVVVTQHLSLVEPRKQSRGLARVKLEGIRLAMRWLLPYADRIVAVSHALAREMHRDLGTDLRKIDVIYNPIVTPEFQSRMNAPVSWPWPDCDVPTLIFVGRLAPEKRLDLLLTAFRELIRACPARLLLLGTGPQESQLHEWIRAGDLTGMCMLCGFAADPLPFIKRADALVLPSDFEGFGNVLVEGMACGTQIVATDSPCGPAEILANGTYGRLVPRGDAAALARAMEDVLQRRFRVPPEILRRRSEDFTLEVSANAYQQIIDSLTGSETPTVA